MAGSGTPQPPQPPAKPAQSLAARPQSPNRNPAPAPVRKPLQVLHISKKDEQQQLEREANEARQAAEAALQRAADLEAAARAGRGEAPLPPQRPTSPAPVSDAERFDMGSMEGLTMADLPAAAAIDSLPVVPRLARARGPEDAEAGWLLPDAADHA